MNRSSNTQSNNPVLVLKYKDEWYKFYSLTDYENWVKTSPDRQNINIHNCKYYKSLGIRDID